MEHLIALSKRGNQMDAIRSAKKYLYTELAQKAFVERVKGISSPSGNIRTTKNGFRSGDSSEVTLVEFVA